MVVSNFFITDGTKRWYLSEFGSDTDSCGESYLQSCKTLWHLLDVIHNSRRIGRFYPSTTEGNPDPAIGREAQSLSGYLEISTDKNIEITDRLLVSCILKKLVFLHSIISKIVNLKLNFLPLA